MRDIDIGLLRAFLAVVESASMTAAARQINLTQGAVSQQIKRLEEILGSPLFSRVGKKLVLTPVGERLVVRAQRLVSLNDETWQLFSAPTYSGEIRLGVPQDIMRPFMPTVLRRFNREYPQVDINIVCEPTPDLIKAVQSKLLDIALTTDDHALQQGQVLMQDRLVWVGAVNGDAYRQRPLKVALGSSSSAFRDSTFTTLNGVGQDWISTCHEGGLEALRATVEADMAVSTLMARSVPEGIEIIDRQEQLPELPDYYINMRLAEQTPPDHVAQLADAIRRGFVGL
jgi:DNA-binding transcriptional LysR family regulator